MGRIAVGLEYDGRTLAGWQTQSGLATVQEHVEAALTTLFDHPVAVVAAGRTDAGVHARGQVLHLDSDATRSERAIVLGGNSNLPPQIALCWARQVPEHFHARYAALTRTYRYCILNSTTRSALMADRVACVFRVLDVDAMQQAAKWLQGTHDFSALRAAECQARSPVRNLTAIRLRRTGNLVVLEVTANAFLHHMVRNIAGLLIHIGQGAARPEFAAEVLATRDRKQAPATAPAAGLYLWRVDYPTVFGLPDESDIMRTPLGCPADLLDIN
jgi:tRNA pseudouridine38-40 synthase